MGYEKAARLATIFNYNTVVLQSFCQLCEGVFVDVVLGVRELEATVPHPHL